MPQFNTTNNINCNYNSYILSWITANETGEIYNQSLPDYVTIISDQSNPLLSTIYVNG